MLSRLIAAPFILIIGIFICFTLAADRDYSSYIIPPAIALVAIYILHPQIDWWWYNRHIPELDPKLSEWFRQHIPFYAQLKEDEQLRFRQRVKLYTIANDFIGKGVDDDNEPPEDVQVFAAACIVMLTFGRADYRMKKFERIVIYPSPFPSPQYPEHVHSSEIFVVDGVILFAVQELLFGITETNRYNIGLHEYIKVFIESYPDEDLPNVNTVTPAQLQQISGFSFKEIEKQIGLPDIPRIAILIHHFFEYPQRFQEILPQEYQQLTKVFNLDLVRVSDPVIDQSLLENNN